MSSTRTWWPRDSSALDRYARPALCVTYLCAPDGSMSRILIGYLHVDFEQLVDVRLRGECLDRAFLRLDSHRMAQFAVAEKLIQTIGILAKIETRNHETGAAVLQPVANTSAFKCDNRPGIHHRLDTDQSEGFGPHRTERDDAGLPVGAPQFFSAAPVLELDVYSEP